MHKDLDSRRDKYHMKERDEAEFEGTLVLEKLAQIDKVDEFFEAVDADDFGRAKSLMRRAGVDLETIATVLKKMAEGDEGP